MENISQSRFTNGKANLRRYHQARWDEPVIFELSTPGERGILVPQATKAMEELAGDALDKLPASMHRKEKPALPELSQNRVLRHYLRLSQETLGADLNVDIGQGTCTMKYNPKINEHLARSPKMATLHPLQGEHTIQGLLQVLYEFQNVIKEVSGMDCISLQPRGGSGAIFTNASIIRAYHESKGQADQRDEIITSIFSHPSDAACAKVAGFKVITLYPGENGYPELDALKAAVSERTAGMIITNPEDTGIFNPDIDKFVQIVHEAGGLCAYDQANANGMLGITRARDAGFDLSHFNIHKTFSTPHACGGPAMGAVAGTEELRPFLPYPLVEFDGEKYYLDSNLPDSIGKVGSFTGVVSMALRAYAWVMNLGPEGLKVASQIAVLNNNYIYEELLKLDGCEAPYAEGRRRIEQVRYSWEKLTEKTGVHSGEIGVRAADFGVHYWTSHHPYVVPEPMTIEPAESYSQKDLDEFVQILAHIVEEAKTDPERVKNAPYNCPVHKVKEEVLDDPARWAMSWRGYQRKLKENQNLK